MSIEVARRDQRHDQQSNEPRLKASKSGNDAIAFFKTQRTPAGTRDGFA